MKNPVNSHQQSTTLSKPNVLIGDYYKCVSLLMTARIEEWVIPKILWIDFRVVPLPYFYHILRRYKSLKNKFSFMEILSIEDYKQILGSNELSTYLKNGFSSLIVNYPPLCTNNHENWTYLKKLAVSMVVNVIVSKDLFPANECTRFVVDS